MKKFSDRPSLLKKRGEGGELREGCGGRRRTKWAAGTAPPSVESVIAMGEARSNLVWAWDNSFEIASLRLQWRQGGDCSPSVFFIKVLTDVL